MTEPDELENREQYLAALVDRHLAAGVLEQGDVRGLQFVAAVRNLASRMSRDFEQVHRPNGLSWAGFRILSVLWVVGKAEPSRIARLSDASPASISSALRSLESAGFIERNRGLDDHRVVEVSMTPAGKRLMPDAVARQTSRETAWTRSLTEDELGDLVRILNKIDASSDTVDGHEPT
ncbi:MarR family winged helix-turn-helix transcriptional regulator [Nitriliruptor alkaliphilus]|uniref:MarR family winged helix-turn-helix transcriptional regulator n=1 Tax=Nitriliruptor alkaliphilus TaxID=427918 RepID=UPI00147080D5|nr:MarR family transcriptional regulator [Nitriliruptor alkaliphilus]